MQFVNAQNYQTMNYRQNIKMKYTILTRSIILKGKSGLFCQIELNNIANYQKQIIILYYLDILLHVLLHYITDQKQFSDRAKNPLTCQRSIILRNLLR